MNWKILALATLLGPGCAAKKIAAENVDFMLEQQIEKRLPLYSSQKKALSSDVNQFLNQQKPILSQAIPYISLIELKIEKIDEHYDYLKTVYEKIAMNFSVLMSQHMSTLDLKQQQEFMNTLKKENEKIEKTHSTDLMSKVHDRFETLFGDETEQQEKIINSFKSSFKESRTKRLLNRKELHKKFELIFAESTSRQTKAQDFTQAFKDYQTTALKGQPYLQLIKEIVPTLDEKQRKVFKERVQDLKELLNYFIQAEF